MPESTLARLARSPTRGARLVRFAAVGGATSLGYALAVALLVDGLATPAPVAAALAYLAMLPANYLGHRRATWRSAAPKRPELVRFLAAHAVTMASCTALMGGIAVALEYSHWAGSLAIVVMAPVMNFILFETWVFRGDEAA